MVRLEGKLTIVLQSAHGLKGDDAYAVVKLGRAGKTAKEVMKTDKVDSHNPVWNATDSVFCKGNYDELTILVKEKSLLTSDDHLGTAKIPTTTFAGGTFAGTLSLVDKELKPAGEIKAILSYEAGKVTVFDKLKRKLADSSDSD